MIERIRETRRRRRRTRKMEYWRNNYGDGTEGSWESYCTPLIVQVESDTEIDLSWTIVGVDEDGFEVWRKLSTDSSFTLLATITTPETTSYQDTTCTAGLVYDYKVRLYNNKVSGTAPIFVSAQVPDANRDHLIITLDQSLRTSTKPLPGDFAVMVNGSARSVSSLSISGSTVTLVLSSSCAFGDTITVALTESSTLANQLRGLIGQVPAASFTAQSVTNNVLPPSPVVLSAAIANATPANVEITFDANINDTSIPSSSAFTLAGKTINNVGIVGTKVTLTVTVAYIWGDVVTVGYTQPGSNKLKGAVGSGKEGNVASFAGQSVTNNIVDPNLVVNGTFDSDTGWTKVAPWTINNGAAHNNDASGFSEIYTIATGYLTIGVTYHIKFTVRNYVSGTCRFRSANPVIDVASNTTIDQNFVCATFDYARFTAFAGFVGDLDDVRITPI